MTGDFGDGEFTMQSYEARKIAVASWLAYHPDMLGIELGDLFAEGLRQQEQIVSRSLTEVALGGLEDQGMVMRDIRGTGPTIADYAQYRLTSRREPDVQFWLSHPDIELTPRERGLLGLLEAGDVRRLADLESSLPFDSIERREANSPGYTELCLGHLVAMNRIVATANGYQMPGYLI